MRFLSRFVLIVVVIAPALHAQDTPGFYVERRTTTVSTGGSGNTTTGTQVTRTWTSAKCSRTEGRAYFGDSTAYLLMLGNPPRSLQVLPRDRVVYALDSVARRAIAGEATPKLSPSDARLKRKSLGDGGLILGHLTRKYEVEFTTRTFAGNAESASAPTTMAYWVAEDPADPMVAAYRAALARPRGGERLGVSGEMVLRSESRSQGRRNVTQVTTNEVLAWRREEVPASRCAVPSGYRTVDQLADLRAKQAATAELQRLSRSSNPADRARARTLGDSMFKELRGTLPPPRSLREDPSAVIIDGKATRKP